MPKAIHGRRARDERNPAAPPASAPKAFGFLDTDRPEVLWWEAVEIGQGG